jgi:hypothetical protein
VLPPKPCRIPDAGKSARLRPALPEAAAWLHDIGYAPGLAVTGLHALDGARLEFKPAPYALASVLTYCDMSTSRCREQQGFEAMRDNGELAARADPAELAGLSVPDGGEHVLCNTMQAGAGHYWVRRRAVGAAGHGCHGCSLPRGVQALQGQAPSPFGTKDGYPDGPRFLARLSRRPSWS